MSGLKKLIGEIVYVLAWPALYFYLKGTHRTRIIVESQGQILVVKNLIGKNEWGLPGGGLHKNEDPKTGVLRELREETGLVLDESDIKVLFKDTFTKERGFSFYVDCFMAHIESPILPKPETAEILKARWITVDDLLKNHSVQPSVISNLEAWLKR